MACNNRTKITGCKWTTTLSVLAFSLCTGAAATAAEAGLGADSRGAANLQHESDGETSDAFRARSGAQLDAQIGLRGTDGSDAGDGDASADAESKGNAEGNADAGAGSATGAADAASGVTTEVVSSAAADAVASVDPAVTAVDAVVTEEVGAATEAAIAGEIESTVDAAVEQEITEAVEADVVSEVTDSLSLLDNG